MPDLHDRSANEQDPSRYDPEVSPFKPRQRPSVAAPHLSRQYRDRLGYPRRNGW